MHAKSERRLSRSGKTKNIGLRVTPEKYAAVEARAEQLDLNIQQTVEHALDTFLTKAGVVLPVAQKPPRRGSLPEQIELISEKLQTIEAGQSTILGVLGEITRVISPKVLIEQETNFLQAESVHGSSARDREAIERSAAEFIEEHRKNSEPLAPVKQDRPGKQAKAAGSDPKRRKRGTG